MLYSAPPIAWPLSPYRPVIRNLARAARENYAQLKCSSLRIGSAAAFARLVGSAIGIILGVSSSCGLNQVAVMA